MRNLKKILSYIMIIFLFLSLKIENVLADETFKMDRGVIKYIVENNEVTIKYCVFAEEEFYLPSKIDGKPVTTIGDLAFFSDASTKRLIIPNSIRSIGALAFSNLTSVVIPNSVINIGENAFTACENLTIYGYKDSYAETYAKENSIPFKEIDWSLIEGLIYREENNEISIIGYNKKDKEINIPSEIDGKPVTSIGRDAFNNCDNLSNITIPDSVTSIGEYAFEKCTSLTNITIPNSITSIEKGTFSDCSNLSDIKIPNSVISIGEKAFFGCCSLYDITIPDSITSIGEYAFEKCRSLSNITIPNSVTSIGDGVLSGCSNLSNIIVEDNNKNYTDIDGVLFNKDKNKIIAYPAKKIGESYVIPNSVISIGASAFSDCQDLCNASKIMIPNSVTSIGKNAFDWSNLNLIIYGYKDSYAETYAKENSITFKEINQLAGNLLYREENNKIIITGYFESDKYINIPDKIEGKSVTSIDDKAFEDCNILTDITIPNSITEIGDKAFFRCRSLSNITIPNSVTSIGEEAFWGCDNLSNITIPKSVTSIGDEAFGDLRENKIIINGYKNSYAEAYAKKNSIQFEYINSSISVKRVSVICILIFVLLIFRRLLRKN